MNVDFLHISSHAQGNYWYARCHMRPCYAIFSYMTVMHFVLEVAMMMYLYTRTVPAKILFQKRIQIVMGGEVLQISPYLPEQI